MNHTVSTMTLDIIVVFDYIADIVVFIITHVSLLK
jgi:hypothetical protein